MTSEERAWRRAVKHLTHIGFTFDDEGNWDGPNRVMTHERSGLTIRIWITGAVNILDSPHVDWTIFPRVAANLASVAIRV